MKRGMVLIALTILLSVSCLPIYAMGNKVIIDNSIRIYEHEFLEEVLYLPIGKGHGEVGYIESGFSSYKAGPASFFVKDGRIMILDNVNEKVIVASENTVDEFKLDRLYWGLDILVTGEDSIYILDSRMVKQYDISGKQVAAYEIPNSFMSPVKLNVNAQNEVSVWSSYDQSFVINRGSTQSLERFSNLHNTHSSVKIEHDNLGLLTLQQGRDKVTIEVPYNFSAGGLVVLDTIGEQIIIEKTEVVPDIEPIISESFIQVLNRSGEVEGAARIPLERMVFLPHHMIKVTNNQIYLLSVEEDGLRVYKVGVGKHYTSFLEERIEEHFMNLESEEERRLLTIQKVLDDATHFFTLIKDNDVDTLVDYWLNDDRNYWYGDLNELQDHMKYATQLYHKIIDFNQPLQLILDEDSIFDYYQRLQLLNVREREEANNEEHYINLTIRYEDDQRLYYQSIFDKYPYARDGMQEYINAIKNEDMERLVWLLSPDDIEFPIELTTDIIESYQKHFNIQTLEAEIVDYESERQYIISVRDDVGNSHEFNIIFGDGLMGIRDEYIPESN